MPTRQTVAPAPTWNLLDTHNGRGSRDPRQIGANMLTILGIDGRLFRVAIVPNKDDSLRPLVEFFDTTSLPNRDQFVSRYYAETLLDHDPQYGLNLNGGVEVWTVPSDQMEIVVSHLKRNIPQ
jgi:hypothetical protein